MLSENSQAKEMQAMFRHSIEALSAGADPEQAAFIVSTINKLRVPVEGTVIACCAVAFPSQSRDSYHTSPALLAFLYFLYLNQPAPTSSIPHS
jgi:hypothetical protein